MRNLNKLLLRAKPQLIDLGDAKAAWSVFRFEHGAKYSCTPLLTPPEANYKFAKTPVPVYGLSLAPDKASGGYSVCDYSTPECRRGCVAYAGQGEAHAQPVLEGRTRKTQFLAENPNAFVTLLAHEIGAAVRKHYVRGGKQTVGVRLNAFSDLEWERITPWLFTRIIPEALQFYDYTKRPFGSRVTPPNYHLTYSVSEKTSNVDVFHILREGGNVAVVTNVKKGDALPTTMYGARVIDGDASDARYVDVSMGGEAGVVIGLRPKGRMRKGVWRMVKEVA